MKKGVKGIIYNSGYIQEFDENGQEIDGNSEYIYDDKNRLVKKKYRVYGWDVDDEKSYELFEERYEYNDLGYRISKLIVESKNRVQVLCSNNCDVEYRDTIKCLDTLISIVEVKLKDDKIIYRKSTDFVENKILLEEYQYEKENILNSKITDFQKNTVIEEVKEYNSELLTVFSKYKYGVNEERKLIKKDEFEYLDSILISTKNYRVTSNELILDFEIRYKYDDKQRLIEEVKANLEKEKYFSIVEYHYLRKEQTVYYFENELQCIVQPIIKLEFKNNYDDEKLLTLNKITIETINDFKKDMIFCRVVTTTSSDPCGCSDFYRCINSESKYLSYKGLKLNTLDLDDVARIKVCKHTNCSTEIENFHYDKKDRVIKEIKTTLGEIDIKNEVKTYTYFS